MRQCTSFCLLRSKYPVSTFRYCFFSDVKRDIEHVERYSQEDAIKKLLRALHDSNDPRWLDIFKKALAQERNVFMYFPLLNLQANMQIGDTART